MPVVGGERTRQAILIPGRRSPTRSEERSWFWIMSLAARVYRSDCRLQCPGIVMSRCAAVSTIEQFEQAHVNGP